MDVIKEFAAWMKENSSLSDSSVYKYSRAVNTVSSDMLERGVISESLLEMPSLILDRAVSDILRDDAFVFKNTTGNNMYSNSLKQFRLFRAVEGVYEASPETVKSVIDNYETLIPLLRPEYVATIEKEKPERMCFRAERGRNAWKQAETGTPDFFGSRICRFESCHFDHIKIIRTFSYLESRSDYLFYSSRLTVRSVASLRYAKSPLCQKRFFIINRIRCNC